MLVPKRQLADILSGARTSVLVPRPPDRARVHRIRRPGGPTVCRVRIVDVREVSLEAVTDTDAMNAGYKDVAEMRDEYLRTHAGTPRLAWTLSSAWEVEFQRVPDAEPVLLLSRQQGARFTQGVVADLKDAGQYTGAVARALTHEPEAVDPDTVKRFSREAREKRAADDQAIIAAYRERPLSEQLRALEQDKGRAAAIRSDMRVVERRIREMWRKGIAAADEPLDAA